MSQPVDANRKTRNKTTTRLFSDTPLSFLKHNNREKFPFYFSLSKQYHTRRTYNKANLFLTPSKNILAPLGYKK